MQHEEELDAAPPVWSGQIGLRDRSDRSPVRIGDGRRTRTREGPRQGRRTLGCSRIGRPPKTPSNVAETKEEQQRGLEKLGFGEDDKK